MPRTSRSTLDSDNIYVSFSSLINLQSSTVRAKRLNVTQLLRLVEELYTARFTKDTAYFKQHISHVSEQPPEIPDAKFPRFVYDYLSSKYKHKKTLEQVREPYVVTGRLALTCSPVLSTTRRIASRQISFLSNSFYIELL